MNNSNSPQQTEPLGNTSLLLSCASKGDVQGIIQLLDKGASVNSCDYDNRTGLHVAASEGQVAVVELLLSQGANVNPVDRWGDTPLANAREYARGAIVKILEQHDAKVQDKRHHLVNDVDPALHYEIDRSELVPVDGVPALRKSATQEVRLVDWRGTKVIAKTLYLSNAADLETLKDLKRELVVLERMRHPNIVQYLCSVTKTSPPIIVTEYLPRGDLNDILSKGPIAPKQAVGYALDISRGMNFLHESRESIVHANLEPRNLLLNEAGQLKITGFGRLVRKSLYIISPEGTEIGSYLYMAPEIFRNEPFDKSVDVFSFGLILHEMFEGLQGSAGATPEAIARKRAFENVRPGFFANSYPRGMKELIQACWHKDPSKRPAFAEIIKELESMDFVRTKHTPKRLCRCIPL